MNLDTWSYRAVHGPNPGAVVREYKWLEIYGLKLVDLVVPPTSHRGTAFAQFAAAHRAAAPLQDEGSYLGLVGIAALTLLVLTALDRGIRTQAAAIPIEAWQVLWIVLCFSTGGLNAILGAAGFTLFRTGCRYSVVILAIALLYAGRRLTRWQHDLESRLPADTARIATLTAAAAAAVVILWDQVPRAPTVDQKALIAAQVEADRDFVARMEAALPPGAMVFQLPIMEFPEAPAPGVPPYDHLRPFIHSQALRYSFGSMKGRPREQWQKDLSKVPFEKAIEEIRSRGFAAIYVNRNGFPDKGQQILAKLREAGPTKPAIESAAGDLVCIPFD
jgi:phosphoglycerol transferase